MRQRALRAGRKPLFAPKRAFSEIKSPPRVTVAGAKTPGLPPAPLPGWKPGWHWRLASASGGTGLHFSRAVAEFARIQPVSTFVAGFARIQPVSGNPSEFLRIQLPLCRRTIEVLQTRSCTPDCTPLDTPLASPYTQRRRSTTNGGCGASSAKGAFSTRLAPAHLPGTRSLMRKRYSRVGCRVLKSPRRGRSSQRQRLANSPRSALRLRGHETAKFRSSWAKSTSSWNSTFVSFDHSRS